MIVRYSCLSVDRYFQSRSLL